MTKSTIPDWMASPSFLLGKPASEVYVNKNLAESFYNPFSSLSADSQEITDSIKKWVNKTILEKRLEYSNNYKSEFTQKRKEHNLTLFFQSLAVPETLGGSGYQNFEQILVLANIISELARADASLALSSALEYSISLCAFNNEKASDLFTKTIAELYTKEALLNCAVILPGAGDKAEGNFWNGRYIAIDAESENENFKLKGKNLRVLGSAKNASLYAFVCYLKDTKQTALAIVPASDLSIQTKKSYKTCGLNAIESSEIKSLSATIKKDFVFTDKKQIHNLYATLNLFSGASSIGAALNGLEILQDWAEVRAIKGNSFIKDNPLTKSVMNEAAEELATAILLKENLAALFSNQQNTDNEKLYAYSMMMGRKIQEKCMLVLNKSLELMGSAGYASEWHIEKHWRDIKTISSNLSMTAGVVPSREDFGKYIFGN